MAKMMKVTYQGGRVQEMALPARYQTLTSEQLNDELMRISRKKIAFPNATRFEVVEVQLQENTVESLPDVGLGEATH